MVQRTKFHTQIVKLDREMVISGLSSLLLYPENHKHTNYIENLIKIILQLKFEESSSFDFDNFQKLVNSSDAKKISQSSLDDPVNNNFVENVRLPQDEYLVLTGITQDGSFNLQNLISAIFTSKDKIMKLFTDKIYTGLELILILSDKILKEVDIDRLTESIDYNYDDIYFPKFNEFETKRKALIISQNDLEEVLSIAGCEIKEFKEFVTFPKDYLIEQPGFIYSHPILFKPFIVENNKYFLVLPTSILDSLRHFILSKMTKKSIRSKKTGTKSPLQPYLFNKYREYCKFQLISMFRFLKVRRKELELPQLPKSLPIVEEIFEFDIDNKMIYSVVVFDDFTKYNTNNPFSRDVDLDDLNSKMNRRIRTIEQFLLKQTQSEILVCVLISPMGRAIIASIEAENSSYLYWLIPFEELSVLTRMRKLDIFDIYRFLKWEKELFADTNVKSFTFLDRFSYYYRNNFSLYFTDSQLPKMVLFGINDGYELKRIAKKMNDVHLTKLGAASIPVTRRENDEEGVIPIYTRNFEDGTIFPYLKLVESFEYPFWVDIGETSEDTIQSAKWLFFEFSEMFAFWVWQFCEVLDRLIIKQDFEQVYLNFLPEEEPLKWLEPKDQTIDPKDLKVEISTNKGILWIEVTIPLFFQNLFMESNNVAERKIMSDLLTEIAKYFNSTLDYKKEFERIIPIGYKKKIHFFQPSDLKLQNKNVPTLHRIRQADIEYYLQNLAENIGKKTVSIIEIRSKEEKGIILKEIVSYYFEILFAKLRKFDKKALLNFLISQYEANICEISIETKTLASQVECYYGIEEMVDELKDRNSTKINTSIVIRILIEIISAEPINGGKRVTITDYLELLAICHHIVNWGIISDYNYLGVFADIISILPSGRIGVSNQNEQRYDRFLSAKFTEDVSKSLDPIPTLHEYSYLVSKYKNIEKDYDEAFIAEFGVGRNIVAKFIGFLYTNAIEEANSVMLISKTIFVEEAEADLELSIEKTERLIDEFSLSPRNEYKKPPDGFKTNDIWPWIYNRRLSYIRRPIIQFQIDDETYLMWGARNSYSSLEQLNQLIISTRYKTSHSSPEMKSFIGKIVDIKGKFFENLVYEWVESNYPSNTNLKNEPIAPSKLFSSDVDLGDIDILTIDPNTSVIYSIECKNII
ncbi:MAG: hypothetical protein ACFE9L_00165 [Candidatus Hodarchaeota archaeon]